MSHQHTILGDLRKRLQENEKEFDAELARLVKDYQNGINGSRRKLDEISYRRIQLLSAEKALEKV